MTSQITTRRIGHSDRPLESLDQDSLGLGVYATGLAEFVQHCDTPFTVAVQGDWGTGKTSLMKMVDRMLRTATIPAGGKPIETVWFQTWQYSQFDTASALPVSLLATLLQCLTPDPGRLTQAKQLLSRLIKPAANAALRIGTMGATELGDFEGMLAEQTVDSAGNANQLKREVEEVVNARLATADRIVVFIDDLDRIKPATAVEVLETIKLFVDVPGCVFVLALDYAVVSKGLQQKFGIAEQDLGRSFFDKIIQLPFSVPVSRYTMDRYIDGLFRDMRLPMGQGDGRLFADLVAASVSVNPRGIKRVFNSLHLLIAMAGARGDRLAIRVLFAVLCLQIGYETVYDWLIDRGETLSVADLEELRRAGEDSRDPDLIAAFAGLPEERRAQFAAFVADWLQAVQDPDRPLTDIDAEELARIRTILTLSRVTSVGHKPAPVAPPANDPEFRWRNRELMERVRQTLQHRLAADIDATGRGFWVNTAHSASTVWLKRNLTADGSLNLVIEHGEQHLLLYVTGGKRAVRSHTALLREVLEPIATPFEDHGDEGVRFYGRTIAPEATLSERETMLLGEMTEIYLSAQERLQKRLWR